MKSPKFAYALTPTWIKVRIVAIGDRADIFVGDMTTPLIHVPDQAGRGAEGVEAAVTRAFLFVVVLIVVVLTMLLFEARRFRFYDVWRHRVSAS